MRRFSIEVAKIETDFALLRHQADLPVDVTLIVPVEHAFSNSPGSEIVKPGVIRPLDESGARASRETIAEVYERYIVDPTRAWSPSTRQAYETTRTVVLGILDDSTLIADLSRSEVRRFIDVLRFLPKNAAKLFPKLSLHDAADRARSNPEIVRISAANANVYLANFSTFLNWCVTEEIIRRNPARGLRLPDEVSKREKRHPFSPEQLKRIFSAPLYIGCQNGERGYATPGRERPCNARYWVPLIGLHTGMRLNEICQLDTTDVRNIEGISCISVTERSLVGTTDKKLKTRGSERSVPLHPRLLDLGLMNYAESLRRDGQVKLFNDIEVGTRGVRAVAFSKWFTQFLERIGARKPRTSYHSLRHNFRDELRSARIDHEVAMALGGWAGGLSRSTAASEAYGRGYRVEVLRDAIWRLRFADIDLSHLR